MRRFTLAALVILSVVGCGPRRVDSELSRTGPRLVLRANPNHLIRPNHVVFTGRWVGNISTAEFHCPAVHWLWGDGAVDSWAADCDPWTADRPNQSVFTKIHLYKTCGLFEARLILVYPGGKHRVSKATINVCTAPSF